MSEACKEYIFVSADTFGMPDPTLPSPDEFVDDIELNDHEFNQTQRKNPLRKPQWQRKRSTGLGAIGLLLGTLLFLYFYGFSGLKDHVKSTLSSSGTGDGLEAYLGPLVQHDDGFT